MKTLAPSPKINGPTNFFNFPRPSSIARATSVVASAGNLICMLCELKNVLKVSNAISYKRPDLCSGSVGKEETISFSEIAFPARTFED